MSQSSRFLLHVRVLTLICARPILRQIVATTICKIQIWEMSNLLIEVSQLVAACALFLTDLNCTQPFIIPALLLIYWSNVSSTIVCWLTRYWVILITYCLWLVHCYKPIEVTQLFVSWTFFLTDLNYTQLFFFIPALLGAFRARNSWLQW